VEFRVLIGRALPPGSKKQQKKGEKRIYSAEFTITSAVLNDFMQSSKVK
jgi:hypothetical protein